MASKSCIAIFINRPILGRIHAAQEISPQIRQVELCVRADAGHTPGKTDSPKKSGSVTCLA
jgi:hypothetical protein